MKALIAGCGIAGAVTAVALRRAGIEVVVAEAYDRTADGVGAFLSLPTNALAVLSELNLLEAVTTTSFPTPHAEVWSATGTHLGQINYGTPLPCGTPAQTIKRADLYQTLRTAAEDAGAQVLYGKRLQSLHSTDTHAQATFTDHTTLTADVLIGADGLHSTTRTLLDPTAPTPRYTGLAETGGYATGVTIPGPPGVLQLTYGRHGLFCHIPHPTGTVWWFAQPPIPTPTALSTDHWRTTLLTRYPDVTHATTLINATPTLLTPWFAHDLPTLPTWHHTRTVLIGDAAHAASPASGQGAAMAIEDAIVLARCLHHIPHIPTALATYTTTRKPRVEQAINQGKLNANLGRVGRLAAPTIFKSLPPNHLAWLTEHRETWSTPA